LHTDRLRLRLRKLVRKQFFSISLPFSIAIFSGIFSAEIVTI